MRPLGYVLMWGSFVAAAYASVFRLEIASDKWGTIGWLGYAIAMTVGFGGIVLIKLALRRDHSDEEKTDAEYSVVRSSLELVSAAVGRLCESEIQPAAILRGIDDECAEPFSDFADSRQALVKRFGMKVYADVMTEFASAERYVNRSWSAAADGYVDEVLKSLQRADKHLKKAQSLLQQAEAAA